MVERLQIAIRAGRAGPWLALALLVRLPALRWNQGWDGDATGFLYFGAGLWRGFFPPLQPIHFALAPATSLLIGIAGWLPPARQAAGAALLEALCGAALVAPLGAIAFRRGGPRAANWTMALAALLHPFVLAGGRFTGESLALLALLGGVAGLESDGRRAARWGGAGALALAGLCRSEAALPACAAALWIAWRTRTRGSGRRPAAALAAALLALAVPLAWNVAVWRATGVFPFWTHGRSALGVGISLLDPASRGMTEAVGRWSPSDLLRAALPRFARLAAGNLRWWLLGALPGALFALSPLPLLRLWRARREPLRLDGCGVVLGVYGTIFLCVWQARNHVPMVLAPLLPAVGAELARLRPRRAALLAAFTAPWVAFHQARGWRDAAARPRTDPLPPAARAGGVLLSDDLPLIDAGGRARWLGRRELPLVRIGDPPAAWRARAARFPEARIAIRRLTLSPPLPGEWPRRPDPGFPNHDIRDIPRP